MTQLRRWIAGASILLCFSALAQEVKPSIAPFPLDLKRTPKSFSEKARKDLAREYRRLLAVSAELPDSAQLESALAQLKRQDCEREDECLSQLATIAQSLYALYASVDLSVDEKRVIATGRVLRDDRQLMGEPVRIEVAKGPRDAFEEVARVALTQLIERLVVGQKLPSFRPKPPDPVVVAPLPAVEPIQVLPPAVEVRSPVGNRSVGQILVAVGGGVVVIGGVLFAVGQGIGRSVVLDENLNVPRAQLGSFETGRTLTTVGLVGAGVGVATAIVGAVLWGVNVNQPESRVTAGLVPVPGGAAFSVQGAF
jgi:hypothetical protein